MNARRLTLTTTLAILCTLAGGLLLSAAVAQAELVHNFVGSFGPLGVGAGTFTDPQGVAVDQATGDVYVYDIRTEAVYKFNASGEPEDFSALGTNAITGVTWVGAEASENELAVDSSGGPAEGDIYVANGEHVAIYSSAGEKLGELNSAVEAAGGPWGEPCGVAVDAAGNVYVGLLGDAVSKYSAPASNPVTNADYTSSMRGVGGSACNIAADSAGNVYAAGDVGNGAEGATKYEASQFGSLAATGSLIDPQGHTLAVEPSTGGDLYVDEGSDIAEYDASGSRLGTFGASGPGALSGSYGVAVNVTTGASTSGDVYADDGSSGVVDIYGPAIEEAEVTTSEASSIQSTTATLNGIVNPAGTTVTACTFEYGSEAGVYPDTVPCSQTMPLTGSTPVPVSAEPGGLSPASAYYYRLTVTITGGSGSHGQEQTFTTSGPPRIVSESSKDVGHTTATLTAGVNPDRFDTRYHFEYGPSTSYGTTTPIPDGDIGDGAAEQSIAANLTGLQAGITYHFRLVASNPYSPTPIDGPDETFTTIPPAQIGEERVSDVAAESATLNAEINPLGTDTRYYFQYGPTTAYGIDMPAAPGEDIGSSESSQSRALHIQGLTQSTLYHFRAVATNALGTVYGADQTFTTERPGGPLVLPDGRKWELVSPATKDGASLKLGEAPLQAAEDGDAITYSTDAPLGAEASGNESPGRTQILSTRGPDGWSSRDIAVPTGSPTGVAGGGGSQYRLFSSDLSLGLVEPRTATPLSPLATEQTLYLRDNANGSYLPLVTSANVPSGTKFGGEGEYEDELHFVDASPDLSHVVFESLEALTANAVSVKGAHLAEDRPSLYGWADGQLQLVSVLPDGQPANADPVNAESGYAFVGGGGANGSAEDVEDFGHAISNDGRVVWSTSLSGNSAHIYLRDMSRGETIQVDAAQGAPEPARGEAQYVTASSDGSRVYFSDRQKLTPGSTAGGLYVFELTSAKDEPLAGRLTDITSSERDTEQRLVYAYAAGQVSPNGQYAAFTSSEGVELYNVNLNRAVCVSCSATNEAGGSGSLPSPQSDDGLGLFLYQPRYLSNSGRLFFESGQALVPQATRGTSNVYEYEPVGVGNCERGSETFVEQSDGCVGLISAGGGTFLDASENGDDVFFMTGEKLAPEDYDSSLDVYDAHVCSAAVPCATAAVSSPACVTADSCKPAPTPQPGIFGPSGSATFSGAGNLTQGSNGAPAKPSAAKPRALTRAQKLAKALQACKKKPKKARARCEAQARKKYGAIRSHKSSKKGRK